MRIDHVMISVPNYQETLNWYQEKFDATIEKEWTVDAFSDLRLAYLDVRGSRIEVVGTTQARAGMPEMSDMGEALRTKGVGHFCFRVDNVDETIAELNKRGVPTFIGVLDAPQVDARICFIKDNNGNLIELSCPMNSL